VEHQKRESSGIKTHEEIAELLKAIKSMEDKIKNPELIGEELFEPEVPLHEVEPSSQIPTETIREQNTIESTGEIPLKKKEKRKKWLTLKPKQEVLSEVQIKRHHSFWKKEKIGELGTDTNFVKQQSLKSIAPKRVTFTLQLYPDGNLVGFPLKKSILVQEKKGWLFLKKKGESAQPEEEPAKGIKGKLLRVVSRIKPKKSSEEESAVGIGSKIKGIFKRKSKE
jgi:hypothetical protein